MLRKKLIKKLSKLLKVEPEVRYKYKTKKETVTEYIDPVKKVHELIDSPHNCYIWQMSKDANEYQMKKIIDNLYSEFVKKNGRDPQALHLIVRDIEEVKHLDKYTLEKIVVPWINAGKIKDKKQLNS